MPCSCAPFTTRSKSVTDTSIKQVRFALGDLYIRIYGKVKLLAGGFDPLNAGCHSHGHRLVFSHAFGYQSFMKLRSQQHEHTKL